MKKRLFVFLACLLMVLTVSTTVAPVVAPALVSAQAETATMKKGTTANVKSKAYRAWDEWACNKYGGDCLLLSMTFRSSNRNVATITDNGKVTARGKGTCKLYCVVGFRAPVGMKSNGDTQYSKKIYYKEAYITCKVK